MRIAILGDVHANDDALRAVIHDARRAGVERFECLGDLVGYHAFPVETLDLVTDARIASVAGNHDLMATGRLSPTACGPRAATAILLTRQRLDDPHRAQLSALPLARTQEGLLFVHSTPLSTEVRLTTPMHFRSAACQVRSLYPGLRTCFTGHTHVPEGHDVSAHGRVRRIDPRARWRKPAAECLRFVNPGSVGLPRDGDPRAAYVIYDVASEAIEFRRVAYDARRICEADESFGLVEPHAANAHVGARALAVVRALARSLT